MNKVDHLAVIADVPPKNIDFEGLLGQGMDCHDARRRAEDCDRTSAGRLGSMRRRSDYV